MQDGQGSVFIYSAGETGKGYKFRKVFLSLLHEAITHQFFLTIKSGRFNCTTAKPPNLSLPGYIHQPFHYNFNSTHETIRYLPYDGFAGWPY